MLTLSVGVKNDGPELGCRLLILRLCKLVQSLTFEVVYILLDLEKEHTGTYFKYEQFTPGQT